MFEQFRDVAEMEFYEETPDFEVSDDILTMDQIKERISPICNKYHINIVYLFGSYSRNEATKNSDIDLLVESKKNPSMDSLLKVCEFENSLQDTLNKKVQVITHIPKDEFHSIYRNNVMKDAVVIYER